MAFDFTEDIFNMKEAFMGPPEKKEKRKGLAGVNDMLNFFNEVSDDNSIQTRKQAALNPIGPTSKDKYKSFAKLAGFNIPRDFSRKNEVPSAENSFGMAYGKDGSLSDFTADKNTDKRINKRRDAYDNSSLVSTLMGERDRQQSVRGAEINEKDPVATSVTTGYRGLPLLSRNDQRAIEDDGIIDIRAKNKEDMKIKLPDVASFGSSSRRPKLGTTARGGLGASERLGSGKNDALRKAGL